MQGYTQHRTLRYFGVRLLFAGYNKDEGFQLFTCILPNATRLGREERHGQNELEKLFSEEMECGKACEFAIHVLKSMTDKKLKAADIEMVVMKSSMSGGAQIEFLAEDDVDRLLARV